MGGSCPNDNHRELLQFIVVVVVGTGNDLKTPAFILLKTIECMTSAFAFSLLLSHINTYHIWLAGLNSLHHTVLGVSAYKINPPQKKKS